MKRLRRKRKRNWRKRRKNKRKLGRRRRLKKLLLEKRANQNPSAHAKALPRLKIQFQRSLRKLMNRSRLAVSQAQRATKTLQMTWSINA